MQSWQTYYRPQKLSDLHLIHVREQMQQLTDTGKLPQVLLFTGPRGTGKTSTARILAAMLNSASNEEIVKNLYLQTEKKVTNKKLHDPDANDQEIVDILHGNSYRVVEIDAASNRGIDDVRRLQEQIYSPPAMGAVVVYIFDEVHMFTTEAFNALLKILEEPPKHAFFILATTELHKIPATVISRCTLVRFQRATNEELLTAFDKIVTQEKLVAEPPALQLLAELADGSFRDGVKLLQTVSSFGPITVNSVQQHFVGNCQQDVEKLIQVILAKDSAQIVTYFANLRTQNLDEKFFLKNLLDFLHQQLLIGLQQKAETVLTTIQAQFLLTNLCDAKTDLTIPFLDLELRLLNIFHKK